MSLSPFDPYSSFVVCGATKSGKSTWVRRLLKEKNHVFNDVVPTNIRYCYGAHDPSYEHLIEDDQEITLHEGLPSKARVLDWCKGQEHLLVVLDDLMSDVVSSKDVEELFTRGFHHNKISVVFVTQNRFAQPSPQHVLPRTLQECSRQESGELSSQTGISGQDRSLSSSIRGWDQATIWLPYSRPDTDVPGIFLSENQNVESSVSDRLCRKRVKLDLITVTHCFKDTIETSN